MKKLIFTLLLTSLASYSQIDLNLTLNNIIHLDSSTKRNTSNTLTVPDNKIWVVQSASSCCNPTISIQPKGISQYYGIGLITDTPVYLTPGTKIFFSDSPLNFFPLYSILEFNAPSTQTGTLALNEIKDINNKIELFPNPTNSKIALNSEKNYTIEIYDMQGQIVMKDKGNTVDLSNLSNAVYILKAYDNYEKTTTSYKVVKK
jgi:hypothetical protein